jgi:hypothetical protein
MGVPGDIGRTPRASQAGLLRGHQVVPSTSQVQVRVERHRESPGDRVMVLIFAAVYRRYGARIVAETLIGLLRADPTSYLSVNPRFRPFLGTDLPLGPTPNPNITGNRTYTRAHFLYYAGVVRPGIYR